ncbi:MAG TPA: lysophospholipid acyltransferase family protein [Acidimicrobiales bacterium]|nr:lysophospholipid acyltransferase family protein [Acidimicrobiales bacterium]
MAVKPEARADDEGGAATGEEQAPTKAEAPGRHVAFTVDPRYTPVYGVARAIFTAIMRAWFRPRVTGKGEVPAEGPVILAPVHRSFADFGFSPFVTDRKLFFMTKDDMWHSRFLGWLLVNLGSFPVHRESADREALKRAEEVLQRGQVLVLFPEGTRQQGEQVTELLEGAAYLAAKTGATIVPLGIGGSDVSMPKGTKIPKRLRIELVVGEPIAPPELTESGRVSRSKVHALSEELRQRIQAVYDEARAAFEAAPR